MAPILILGVGSSHSIQIISRFYEEFLKTGDRTKALTLTLSGISRAALIAIITDAAGFCSAVTICRDLTGTCRASPALKTGEHHL